MGASHTQIRRGASLLLFLGVQLGTSGAARADLGWTEADYVKHFGPALHSPAAPNEAQFVVKGRGQIVVIFAAGHSTEEAWLIAGQAGFVPRALMDDARGLVRGTPVRRVDFQLPRAPAAQIFERHDSHGWVQVDYRNGAIMRIGRCRGPQACVLLDRFLAIDRNTDALMARTEAAMRREAQ